MDNQEATTDRLTEDKFYKKEVRLEEGIDLNDVFSGKGSTFTIKQEDQADLVDNVEREKRWDANEIGAFGIDETVHEGGAFKGIEKEFAEKVTEDGMIVKKVVKPGAGPIVPTRAWVKVHYTCYAEGHDEPIDSTRLRNRPFDFILGDGGSTLAFDLAVATMKKNEKSRFLCDFPYCFGEMGVPPRIPKKARLLYEIEVVHYVDENLVNEYDAMSPDDRRDIPIGGILKLAAVCRERGNQHYRTKTVVAHNSYLKGYRILDSFSSADQNEEYQVHCEKIKLCLNLAQTSLEYKGKTVDCRHYSNEAIQLLKSDALKNPFKIAKAHFTMHKSWKKEGKLDKAKKSLEEAVKFAPDDADIRKAFVKLEEDQAKADAIERGNWERMGEKMGWRDENKD